MHGSKIAFAKLYKRVFSKHSKWHTLYMHIKISKYSFMMLHRITTRKVCIDVYNALCNLGIVYRLTCVFC